MLISTLPDLAGRTFEVRGFVYAASWRVNEKDIKKMLQKMIEQAEQLGADGIVDVKTVMGGESANCMMTGTAVKLRG